MAKKGKSRPVAAPADGKNSAHGNPARQALPGGAPAASKKPKKKKLPPQPGPGPRSGWVILALDPAASCGWAYTHGKWGVQQFVKRPWRHPYAHYLDFRAWLLERIETLGVTALAYEGSITTGYMGGDGQRKEWQSIILAVAAECDLPVVCVFPSQLKKYATGDGSKNTDREAMRAALAARFGLQLPEDQHDAVAAIWVLSWATAEMKEGRITREWTGFPRVANGRGRSAICNRCQFRFDGGLTCPRCGCDRTRLEA